MPTITVDGKTAEFDADERLVLAIEAMGIEIGHRCGGKARCTTCRVEVLSGEPDTMTRAEYDKLVDKGRLGEVRLSCQLLCDRDMEVRPLVTRASEGWPDTGPEPAAEVEPEAEWFLIEDLAAAVES